MWCLSDEQQNMWNRTNKPEPSEPFIFSRIGPKTTINGQILSQEDLFIDGNVRGEIIRADSCRLIFGPNARVTANASARDVVILGQLNGDVEASGRTSVRNNGSLVGDIRTAGVLIEDDAFFRGKIDIVNNRFERAQEPEPEAEVEAEVEAEFEPEPVAVLTAAASATPQS
jgi:cytoskeletal protein CcmA (bactofilin family)